MSNDSLDFPYFESEHPSVILVPSGTGFYVLENTASTLRFPFESPNSSPYIAKWKMTTAPNTTTSMISAAAWVLGTNQTFDHVKFQVGLAGSLGGGSLGPLNGTGDGPNIPSPNG